MSFHLELSPPFPPALLPFFLRYLWLKKRGRWSCGKSHVVGSAAAPSWFRVICPPCSWSPAVTPETRSDSRSNGSCENAGGVPYFLSRRLRGRPQSGGLVLGDAEIDPGAAMLPARPGPHRAPHPSPAVKSFEECCLDPCFIRDQRNGNNTWAHTDVVVYLRFEMMVLFLSVLDVYLFSFKLKFLGPKDINAIALCFNLHCL